MREKKDIDYRLTSLVHHVPAEDGGLIAGVDQFGSVFLRDNSIPLDVNTNPWTIHTQIKPDDVPLILPIKRLSFQEGNKTHPSVTLQVKSYPSY